MIDRLIPMGLLAFGAVKGADKVKDFLSGTQEVTVQYEIGEIIKIIELDYMADQRFPDPNTFPEFLRSNMRSKVKARDTAKDHWGTDYKLELKNGTAIVRSAGPDKQYNSSDDIYGVAKP